MPATIPFVVRPEREGSFPGFPLSGKFMQTLFCSLPMAQTGVMAPSSVTSLLYWEKYGMERGLCWKQHCVLTPVIAGEAGPEFRSGSAASPWGWGGAAGQRGDPASCRCLSCSRKRRAGRSSACHTASMAHRHSATPAPLPSCQVINSSSLKWCR